MLLFDRQGGAAGAMCDALSGKDYISLLESALSAALSREVIAMCSADAALHTALYLCGVRSGDYVIVPTRTFYTYVNTVVHAGGVPIFVDCDPKTRCLSAPALETALVWAELQNKPPKAVVADDAFGAVADYDVISPLCKSFGVPVIELACDALGGGTDNRPCGANGDYGVLGFNKRILGGGGALVCSDDRKSAAGFARAEYSPGETHDYTMHNVVAALDFAQLESLKKVTARARANLYSLVGEELALEAPAGDNGAYAFCKAGGAAARLKELGFVVKRPPPVHLLPEYAGAPYFEHERGYSVSESFGDRALIGMDISALKRRRLARMLKCIGRR